MNTPASDNDETSRRAKALLDKLEAGDASEGTSAKSWMGRSSGGPNLVVVLAPLWAWVLVMVYLKPTGALAFFAHLLLGGAFVLLALWSWKGSLWGWGGSESKNQSSTPEDLHLEAQRSKERRERYEKMRARHEKVTQRKKSDPTE